MAPSTIVCVRSHLIAMLITAVAFPSIAAAAAPDPDKFTPRGYEFCGWQDFAGGGWAMEWSENLAGAYLVAFADGMSCTSARRNVKKMRSTKKPPYRPLRDGYRCVRLKSGHEYADVRCVKVGGSRKFRFQTGA